MVPEIGTELVCRHKLSPKSIGYNLCRELIGADLNCDEFSVRSGRGHEPSIRPIGLKSWRSRAVTADWQEWVRQRAFARLLQALYALDACEIPIERGERHVTCLASNLDYKTIREAKGRTFPEVI